MTRKHFAAIAAILRSVKPKSTGVSLQQWERDVIAMATVCGRFNPTFKRDTFLIACGLSDDTTTPTGGNQ